MKPEQLNKLPKWAQDHIKTLQRERDVALRELNEWTDGQTPSGMYIDEMVCTGEEQGPSVKRRYIQSNRVTVEHAGVMVEVWSHNEGHIAIRWGRDDGSSRDVAMIPQSYQRANIVSKENMRA